VTNPANYMLVFVQSNFTIRRTGCTTGASTFDHVLPIGSVSYSRGSHGNGPYVATITFNPYTGGDVAFSNDQNFRLYVCGTTSIHDLNGVTLAGDGDNPGTDFARNFIVTGSPSTSHNNAPAKIPATGFAPNRVTVRPAQPAGKAYTALGPVYLEIPKLGIKANITGIPQQADGSWDVTWLNNDAGWLQGSAFPSLPGNSVLTGHYFNSYGTAGPFRYLGLLAVGDQVIVHVYGTTYVYQVRSLQQVDPGDITTMMKHEETSWLSLVTCVDYLANNDFKYRLIVHAELTGKY
jgi:LPXTG-site transpeptidase (sortase) family protein